jgi:hypothetical protein
MLYDTLVLEAREEKRSRRDGLSGLLFSSQCSLVCLQAQT